MVLLTESLWFHKAYLDLYRKMLASAWTEYQTDPMDAESMAPHPGL